MSFQIFRNGTSSSWCIDFVQYSELTVAMEANGVAICMISMCSLKATSSCKHSIFYIWEFAICNNGCSSVFLFLHCCTSVVMYITLYPCQLQGSISGNVCELIEFTALLLCLFLAPSKVSSTVSCLPFFRRRTIPQKERKRSHWLLLSGRSAKCLQTTFKSDELWQSQLKPMR